MNILFLQSNLGLRFKPQPQSRPKSMLQSQHFQYIIIGAGISGLHAAQILSQNKKSFIILQATNILGGRIRSSTLREIVQEQKINPSVGIDRNVKECQPKWMYQNPSRLQSRIQIGATWIAQSHTHMFRLLKQLKIQVFQQNREGFIVYGQQIGKYLHLKELADYYTENHGNSAQVKQKIENMLNKLAKLKNKFNKLYQQVIQNKYYDKAKQQQYTQFINKHDSISVKQYLQSELNDTKLAEQLMNFIQCLQCIPCDKFSLLQLIDDDDSLEIVYQAVANNLVESDDGFRVSLGMSTIIHRMLQKICHHVSEYKPNSKLTDIIKFSEPVIKIQTWPSKKNKLCKVYVSGQNGTKIYQGKRVLNSIPIATLNKVQITNLSLNKQILFGSQQVGNVQRVYFVFTQPFWRTQFNGYGLFGPEFPFNQMTDITPFDKSIGVLALVFYANKYEQWTQKNPVPQNRIMVLKQIIADMFLKGDIKSHYMRDCYTFSRTFSTHQYIKAAYQPTTKMGAWKAIHNVEGDYEQAFTKDQNGVFYIGSEFSDQYGSYMQGSLRITRKKVFALLSIPDPWKN